MRGCGRGSRLLTGRSALCTAACRSPRAWHATGRFSLRVARVHALGRCAAPPHPQAAPAWQPLRWARTRRRQRRSPCCLRPLRYDGERPTTKGSYGANASYEHEWRISTWAFNLPGTFPHSAFRQRYGTPFDEGLLALVRGAGLLRLLELVKRQFEQALLARGAAAAAAVGAATLSQLFLTVQPHKQRMNDELASYMQSHYDPAAARLGLTPSATAPRRPRPRPDSSLEPLVPSEASAVAAQATLPRPRCPGHAARGWAGGGHGGWGARGWLLSHCPHAHTPRILPPPSAAYPRIPASNAHCTLRARCRCSRSTSTSRRSTTAAAFPPRTGWCCTASTLLGSAYYGPTHHGSLHHGPLALFTKVLHGLDGRLEPPLMLPTPLGAVALLWADEHGQACFHTAGDLSAGARVVLNSFWQTPAAAAPAPRSPSPPAEAPRDALPRREVPGAAAAGSGTAAFNRATRVEARTCGEGSADLLAATSWLRAARQAGTRPHPHPDPKPHPAPDPHPNPNPNPN